jgi:stage II sporulation protein M
MYKDRLALATAAACTVFFVTVLLGGYAIGLEGETGEIVRQQVEEISQQLAGQIITDNPALIALYLFLNNLQACVLLFLGGATLGIFTMLVLAVNGMLVGAIVGLKLPEQGLLWIAAALLPHGIFEVPAILIAGGLGFLLAEAILREVQGTGNAAAEAKRFGKTFLRVVVPLLMVAAVIEAFITPLIVFLVA